MAPNVGQLGVARHEAPVDAQPVFDLRHDGRDPVAVDPRLEGDLAVAEEEGLVRREVEVELHLQVLRELA